MPARFFPFIVLWAVLFYGSAAQAAYRIAVIPVEDLSGSRNSVNLELSHRLEQELSTRDLQVISSEEVISFMARKRIRWLGYLDTDHIIQAKDELGVDLLLFGTICQRREKISPAFGLSLYLVRTSDAKTIWTASGGLSLADVQHLLGLFEPTSLDDLWPELTRQVMSDWPADLAAVMGQALLFDLAGGEQPSVLSVDDIVLEPRYVRPGEQVRCSVRLSLSAKHEEAPQIFIKVGSRVHLAQESTDGMYYEASWTGSEVDRGIYREVGDAPLNLAMQDLDVRFFEGIWSGSERDDRYPVSLILNWPNGEQQSAFLGYYTVDSHPPQVELDLKGRVLQGEISFRDKLFVIPSILNREPFSQWQIRIENDNGTLISTQRGEGGLPPVFVWKGQQANGFPVEEGKYRIVLNVWDRAGNEAEAAKTVSFRPNPPDLVFDAELLDQDVRVRINKKGDIPLAYWHLEVWSNDGYLLKKIEGDELPVQMDIPLASRTVESNKIEGKIVLQDILGNQTRMEFGDLLLLAMQHKDSDEAETSEAAEEKDDSDSFAWLSEF